jgi:hypothetical protein
VGDNGAVNQIKRLVLAVAVLIVACGGNGEAPPPADLTAEQILERAARNMADVTSFHFRLTHENGTTQMPLNLELRSAEGDVAVPDRLSAEVQARAVATNVRVRAIAIGDRTWITNPFTRQWQRLPGEASLRDVADPAGFINAVVDEIRDARLAGQDRIDGVQSYKVVGQLDSGALRRAIGSARAGITVDVEVWVGAEDFLPRRVRVIGPLENDDADNIVRELQLSRFNQPVDIQPP